jgi:DNA-binding GntR family transcriptional regulator
VLADRGTYRVIATELARRIDTGELRPGEMLPSEPALSAEFAVARGTVRAALALLEERGLAEVIPGTGRRVLGERPDGIEPTTAYERLAEAMRQRIAAGEFDDAKALPSEAALTSEYGVSRTTVRRAYELLKAEGVVVVRPGVGAFIRSA